MGVLLKLLVASLGIILALYFYSWQDDFKPEMLKGKRVIVTGASTGIGEQMAYHLARMGSHVVITARTEEKLKQVVLKCLELGAASAHYVAGSMNDMAVAERVVKEAEKLLGGLDFLIMNHLGSSYFNYFTGDVDQVRQLMEVNFLSFATMTVAALPMLKESDGHIIVVSSMAGEPATSSNHTPSSDDLVNTDANYESKRQSTEEMDKQASEESNASGKFGYPFLVPYAATKFALDGFFSSLRQEFHFQKLNVSITLCILSYINTENTVRAVEGTFNQVAAPKEECALEIIKGGALRQREVYYQYQHTKIPLLLRDWLPDVADYYVRTLFNLEKIVKP